MISTANAIKTEVNHILRDYFVVLDRNENCVEPCFFGHHNILQLSDFICVSSASFIADFINKSKKLTEIDSFAEISLHLIMNKLEYI
jgi:hypothetical protein